METKNKHVNWTLTDLEGDLPQFSEEFRAFCEAQGLDDGKIFELELSLEELIVNSFTHGYSEGEGGNVTVDAENTGEDIKVTMADKAPPFNLFRDAPAPRLGGEDAPSEPHKEEKEGGLGIHLVKSLNDRVEYHGSNDGNEVVIIKSIK